MESGFLFTNYDESIIYIEQGDYNKQTKTSPLTFYRYNKDLVFSKNRTLHLPKYNRLISTDVVGQKNYALYTKQADLNLFQHDASNNSGKITKGLLPKRTNIQWMNALNTKAVLEVQSGFKKDLMMMDLKTGRLADLPYSIENTNKEDLTYRGIKKPKRAKRKLSREKT
ncbi:MAG: hypothetical protein ACI9XP_002084 [Lentimonas sp.]|jgi:hypothetical protein